MKIIEMTDNQELIKEASSLGNFFLDMYGEGTIGVLAVLNDDGKYGFVGLNSGYASYAQKVNDTIKHFEFGHEGNYELSHFASDNVTYVFIDGCIHCRVAGSKIQQLLRCINLPTPNEQEYESYIVYCQENNDEKTSVNLRYRINTCNPNEIPYIYDYRVRDFDLAYLIDNNKKGFRTLPGLGNRYHFYVGRSERNNTMINDYFGQRFSRYSMRYYRLTHLLRNGFYSDTIFSRGISKEELCLLISSYGFDFKIPERLVNIYNKQDKEYLFAISLLEQLKNIMENKENSKKATMVLSKNN